jgi:glycosyltransferase involved in cell wall biosynthesis
MGVRMTKLDKLPILYLVVPCYNEESVLRETSRRLSEKFSSLIKSSQIDSDSKILFVDDGSSDKTWKIIADLHESNHLFYGLKLSRNCGHQKALLSGLHKASEVADLIASMDADLQDDINALDEMVSRAREGYEVVYGVRNDRSSDSFLKRFTAQSFYRVQASLGVDAIYNHADYRLMSKRAVLALAQFNEVNLFLRGLVPLVGFKSCCVYYSRGKRFAGESKYTLNKMISFAFEGITSFSTKPIRLITLTGLTISVFSFFALVYLLIGHFIGDVQVGWTSIIMSIWCLGGLQLLALGVIGEYVGKTYMETKHRPRYFIEEFLSDKEDKDA